MVNAFRRYQKPALIHVWGEADVPDLLNILLEPCSGSAECDKLEEGVEKIGAHRILFGTNFPALNPGVALSMVADARLSDADKRLILGGNAAKLFALERPEAAAEGAAE